MAEPQVARTIFMVPVAEIDPAGGLRPLDQTWVDALCGMLAVDGQRRAIEIFPKRTGGYGVIAGRHRLAAVTKMGWATIDADIVEATALDRRLAEVSENLHRRELAPLDRAAFVAEQIAILKARAGVAEDAAPQSVAANARWSERLRLETEDASDIVARAYGFSDDMAAATGLSRRSIYRDLELHRGLRAEVVEALREHPVAANAAQLRTLAKLPEADQRQATELLLDGSAKSVSDAVGILKQKPLPNPTQKAWSALQSNWARLSERDRKLWLAQLSLPRGVRLEIDGQEVGGDHG